jgi:hypothetical protein
MMVLPSIQVKEINKNNQIDNYRILYQLIKLDLETIHRINLILLINLLVEGSNYHKTLLNNNSFKVLLINL